MKHLLLTLMAMALCMCSYSQITITASNMPVAGDTFIYSTASALGTTISPADSGTNINWNYALTPTGQGMNIYYTTGQVNLALNFTLPGLYGYKTADSIPFIGLLMPGISIQNLYTYFKKTDTPSSVFEADGFSADFAGITIGTPYTQPDIWYSFPLTYGSSDSNNYFLNVSLLTAGGLKEMGYRKTRVDGWGSITTPYYTTPIHCIRVRSEIHEIDSIAISGTNLGIPRNTVEYKWLNVIDHHPALWVMSNMVGGTEIVTSIQYRDKLRNTGITSPAAQKDEEKITAYPNPAPNGIFTLQVPEAWQTYHVDVFDMQSRVVLSQDNERMINISPLPAGSYVARVLCGTHVAFVTIIK